VIVTKLMGGLGNQMFQYSLGRRLALERGVPLKLDLSWFGNPHEIGEDTVREYALDGWRIRASVATAEDLANFPSPSSLLVRLGLLTSPVLRDRGLGFERSVLRLPSHAHLTGYWHSEKYFKTIRETLLCDFTLSATPCSHVTALLDRVQRPNSVALHVRRGDYAANPRTQAFHGLCPIEYYWEAVHRIADQVVDPSFFVFSDDPAWVRENLKLDWPTTYVTHGGDCLPHHDMWLMSLCAHHVIANSSFSWWGAWLCRNEKKIVLAPARWFTDDRYNHKDITPEGWTRI
jgi:hypothetical protein